MDDTNETLSLTSTIETCTYSGDSLIPNQVYGVHIKVQTLVHETYDSDGNSKSFDPRTIVTVLTIDDKSYHIHPNDITYLKNQLDKLTNLINKQS